MADDAANSSPDEAGVPSNHDSSDDAQASPESESQHMPISKKNFNSLALINYSCFQTGDLT